MPTIRTFLVLGILLLSGCSLFNNLQSVDVSQATCDTISEFRVRVGEEYTAKLEVISDAFWEAKRAFNKELNECMYQAWEGNPCDQEWEELQEAYEQAMGDISNDDAYNNYKAKQKNWNKCHENFDAEQESFAEKAREKERQCQEQFQQKVDQAIAARQAEEQRAKEKRDSDLAYLADLEKRCQEEEKQRLARLAQSAQDFASIHNQQVLGPPTTYEPQSAACTGITEETRTRTRQEQENMTKEIAMQVAQQLFDELGKTPIPTDAISDKIFAGIVCTKLYARILELEIENAPQATINRYRKAQSIWCRIASGQQQQVKEEIRVFVGESATCQSDGECGQPVCCSASEIGKWVCADGNCTTMKEACPENTTCQGTPAQCVANATKIQAIFYGGKLIPVSAVRKGTGQECDQVEHWHGNATTLDGSRVNDPDPNGCGYGKVSDVPVVEVWVKGKPKIEVRMGL